MNNLPIEVKKDGLFKRLLKFIKNIFKKEKTSSVIDLNINTDVNINNVEEPNNKIRELYKVSNIDTIGSEYFKEQEKKKKIDEIIQIIEKEPKTLKKLEIPQLEVIDNYYKEKIIECKKKIAKYSV